MGAEAEPTPTMGTVRVRNAGTCGIHTLRFVREGRLTCAHREPTIEAGTSLDFDLPPAEYAIEAFFEDAHGTRRATAVVVAGEVVALVFTNVPPEPARQDAPPAP